MIDWSSVADEAALLLSRYVQIDTTNPPGHEMPAAEFLSAELRARGFDPVVYEPAPGRANVVARLPHTCPDGDARGAIILLHHMDVVTADPARWSCDPFGGEVRDGYVWGRGTIDMKGMGIMALLALDLLRRDGGPRKRAPRTRDLIYLAVADEEVASAPGVRWLLDRHAGELEAEFVWDEGGFGLRDFFGPGTVFTVAVAEKQALWLRVVAEGEPGHGGMPHAENANDILVSALSRIHNHVPEIRLHDVTRRMFSTIAGSLPFPKSWVLAHLDNPLARAVAAKGLTAAPAIAAILQNTVSVTGLHAGSKANVIPEQAEAVLDARLLPGESPDAFVAELQRIIADDRVHIEVVQYPSPRGVSDYDSIFFRTLAEVAARLVPGSLTVPLLTPGATDSAYFRERGYNTYGLFPAILTADELAGFHGIDERISIENLGLGTRLMVEVLRAV